MKTTDICGTDPASLLTSMGMVADWIMTHPRFTRDQVNWTRDTLIHRLCEHWLQRELTFLTRNGDEVIGLMLFRIDHDAKLFRVVAVVCTLSNIALGAFFYAHDHEQFKDYTVTWRDSRNKRDYHVNYARLKRITDSWLFKKSFIKAA